MTTGDGTPQRFLSEWYVHFYTSTEGNGLDQLKWKEHNVGCFTKVTEEIPALRFCSLSISFIKLLHK